VPAIYREKGGEEMRIFRHIAQQLEHMELLKGKHEYYKHRDRVYEVCDVLSPEGISIVIVHSTSDRIELLHYVPGILAIVTVTARLAHGFKLEITGPEENKPLIEEIFSKWLNTEVK